MNKDGMKKGRKEPLTDIQRQFIENLRKSLGNVTLACKATEISRTTYYNWLNNITFKKEVENIDEEVKDRVEFELYKKIIEEKNTAAIIFFAKTRMRDRGYIEKLDVEHSGAVNNIIQVKVVETAEEELEKLENNNIIEGELEHIEEDK